MSEVKYEVDSCDECQFDDHGMCEEKEDPETCPCLKKENKKHDRCKCQLCGKLIINPGPYCIICDDLVKQNIEENDALEDK